jgi:EAL domain-containing protein (putative c-di-GMP-specific phosphodiesterase class I)
VTAIMVLARNLGLEVVVEGVENTSQIKFLQEHPGIIVQGYFLSPPLPADEVERLLREQPPGK